MNAIIEQTYSMFTASSPQSTGRPRSNYTESDVQVINYTGSEVQVINYTGSEVQVINYTGSVVVVVVYCSQIIEYNAYIEKLHSFSNLSPYNI